MGTNNAINIKQSGLVKYDGSGTFTGTTITFQSDSGNATLSSDAITIAGGSGISTSATGSTVTITNTGGGGGGITTIDGDTGSATGSTVTISTAGSVAGSSVIFSASSDTVLLNVSDANSNTLIGNGAGGVAITTAQLNTGLGYAVLDSLITGNYNSCLGYAAGDSLVNGSNNVFVGYASGDSLIAANDCIGIGYSTLPGNETGNANIVIGSNAGNSLGTTDASNILIGFNVAGINTQSNNLIIGNGTGTSEGNLNAAYICGIQTIVVTGTPILISTNDQLGVAASSIAYKEDIQDMGDDSSLLMQLRPVTFKWKESAFKNKPESGKQFGLIAQEVAQIFPDLVIYDDAKQPFSVKYHDLPALLLNEIQKLSIRIKELEKLSFNEKN